MPQELCTERCCAHLRTLMHNDTSEVAVTRKRKKVKVLHLLEVMQQVHCLG